MNNYASMIGIAAAMAMAAPVQAKKPTLDDFVTYSADFKKAATNRIGNMTANSRTGACFAVFVGRDGREYMVKDNNHDGKTDEFHVFKLTNQGKRGKQIFEGYARPGTKRKNKAMADLCHFALEQSEKEISMAEFKGSHLRSKRY